METLIDTSTRKMTDDDYAEDELMRIIAGDEKEEVNNCGGCDNTRTYSCATYGGCGSKLPNPCQTLA